MRDEGYNVETSSSGEEGLSIIRQKQIDLILLDINLPGMDGLEVCNKVKSTKQIPIIFLSCRDKDADVISGLEIGAEDYIRKPFNHRELSLRVKKLLKRSQFQEKRTLIETGKLSIRTDREEIYFDSVQIKLTPVEYKLLEVLGGELDWVFPWEILLKEAWGYEDWEGGRDMVKVNIRRLRKKIEPDPSQPIYLLTERGRGYKLAII